MYWWDYFFQTSKTLRHSATQKQNRLCNLFIWSMQANITRIWSGNLLIITLLWAPRSPLRLWNTFSDTSGLRVDGMQTPVFFHIIFADQYRRHRINSKIITSGHGAPSSVLFLVVHLTSKKNFYLLYLRFSSRKWMLWCYNTNKKCCVN